jgi:cytosine/adenosine deaminase-related metal-dependent hydrolase
VVFKMTSPYASPVFDPIRSLVYYSGSHDVRHSVVNGNAVVQDGAVTAVDAEEAYAKVQEVAERLWTIASDSPAEIFPPGSSWYRRGS